MSRPERIGQFDCLVYAGCDGMGRSVMKSVDLFLSGIRKVIRKSCRYVPFEKTELALPSLGDDANLIGAAATVWHHRFASGGQK